jgi:hypothetical protein
VRAYLSGDLFRVKKEKSPLTNRVETAFPNSGPTTFTPMP